MGTQSDHNILYLVTHGMSSCMRDRGSNNEKAMYIFFKRQSVLNQNSPNLTQLLFYNFQNGSAQTVWFISKQNMMLAVTIEANLSK